MFIFLKREIVAFSCIRCMGNWADGAESRMAGGNKTEKENKGWGGKNSRITLDAKNKKKTSTE